MRRLTGLGIRTSLESEIELWEICQELLPSFPPSIAGSVENLFNQPDFIIPLPNTVYRFWASERLIANRQAAAALQVLFKAMQSDYEFLHCLTHEAADKT